jgi:hypothetical protein
MSTPRLGSAAGELVDVDTLIGPLRVLTEANLRLSNADDVRHSGPRVVQGLGFSLEFGGFESKRTSLSVVLRVVVVFLFLGFRCEELGPSHPSSSLSRQIAVDQDRQSGANDCRDVGQE